MTQFSSNEPTVRNVRGIKIFSFKSVDELVSYSLKNQKILIAVNAEKILKSDNQFKSLINNNIGYCDGIGAVWALRSKGAKDAVRIPGVELWLDIIRRNLEHKSFYFVGATQKVIAETVGQLKVEFSGIRILGYRNGYLRSKEEKEALIADIVFKKPDFIFVAMGSPAQEILMSDMLAKHKAIYQGLGGSFDVYTGNVKRAPKVLQSLGLEWFYRLFKQPHRLKRYLPLGRFFYLLVCRKL